MGGGRTWRLDCSKSDFAKLKRDCLSVDIN